MVRVKRGPGAQSLTYPKAFRARQIATNRPKLYVHLRRAGGGRGPMGEDSQEPAAMALPLPRPRYGAPRLRPRAHLPRSVLERVLREAKTVQRGGTPALREALRPPWRHACGLRAIRGL